MRTLLLVVAALVLAGCATERYTFDPGAASAYLAAHRDRPANVANALASGNLAQGMTEEEVRICWGKPDTVMTQYQASQQITTWSYTEPRIIASSFRRSLWSYQVARQAIFINGALREWRVIQELQ